jgi:hypothetical protein
MSRDDKKPRLHLVGGETEGGERAPEGMSEALRAAHGGELDAGDNDALLALALGDGAVDFDGAERRDAEALAAAIDAGRGHDFAELCGALRSVARATADAHELDAADHDALLAVALGEDAGVAAPDDDDRESELCEALRAAAHPADLDQLAVERALRRAFKQGERKQERRVSVVTLFGGIATLAAGVALLLTQLPALRRDTSQAAAPQAAAAAAALIGPRSTQDLFDPQQPFAVKGGESDRLGKIVTARAADLRANRFAAWGVK